MTAVLLALTALDVHSPRHLEKAATLAVATGMQLRLAYGGTGHNLFDSPLARLEQRARHLRRQFDLAVDTVEEAMTSLDVLRFHANRCTLLCLAADAAEPPPQDAHWLARALRLHTVPVLVMQPQTPAHYRKVLVPVSLRGDSAQLLRWAAALAAQAQIDVVHVAEPTDHHREDIDPIVAEHCQRKAHVDAHKRMSELARGLHLPSGKWHYGLTHGPVRERILAQHQHHGHALVVLGSSPRPCWAWLMRRRPLGLALASELPADVLIVPQTRSTLVGMPARLWRSAA